MHKRDKKHHMTNQVKSRKRVVNHGEVFTAEREVKAMCDLVWSPMNVCESIRDFWSQPVEMGISYPKS